MPFWTKRALQNLDIILNRIALDDPDTAEKIAEKIEIVAKGLDEFQRMGKDGILEGTREFVFPKLPYVLVYRLTSRVEIIRFLHSRQQR
jgi:plasmid stabilization system protein ParE